MRKPKKNFLLGIFPINTRGKVRGARSYVNIGDGVWGLGYYRAFGLKLVDTVIRPNSVCKTMQLQTRLARNMRFHVSSSSVERRGEERRRGGVGVGVEARAKGGGQNNRRNGKEERVQHHLRKHHVWYIERLIGRDELLHGDPFRETVDRWSSAGCLGLLNEPTRQRKQKCAASEALAMTSRVD
ncbi:hypothetical protein HZH68_007661 [Vespula germanica]|uniref:Uncharacterized protein n=1 Tax=Vespula germanica TaxID=30212 RepID=A0A834K819_VESGE|nr:hypothetical protein HZH68_007661 [Vespula germanica]